MSLMKPEDGFSLFVKRANPAKSVVGRLTGHAYSMSWIPVGKGFSPLPDHLNAYAALEWGV